MAVPAAPAPASAADISCFVGRADTTYRVAPQAGKVRVIVDYLAMNRCRDYRLIGWQFGWIPITAEKVRFSGPGVSAKPDERDGQWRSYVVRFPALNPGGSLRWRVTYELPTGRPGAWNELVLDDDYWHLCWTGHGADSGSTQVIFPRRSRPLTYIGNASTKYGPKSVVVSAKGKGSPNARPFCTDVYDVKQMKTERLVSPGGTRVKIQGFADDPSWSARVRSQVEQTIPRLEEIFGSPASRADAVTIREVPEKNLGGYAGMHYESSHIRLGSDADEMGVVAHEIAHQWSDSHNFAGTWLQEGIADWVANEASPLRYRTTCYPPGDYPGKGKPRLSKWLHLGARPTERQEDIVDWQYDAACHIHTRLGFVMRNERMVEVIRALTDGRPPYGGSPRTKTQRQRPADWREWLDAVDEIGLVPAGAKDLKQAEAYVIEFGIAGKKALAGRYKARTRYHDLLDRQSGVAAPLVVRDAMEDWRFKEAHKAMDVAESVGPRIAAALAVSDVEADPDAAAALAKLRRRYEDATDLAALRRVRADARRLPTPADLGQPSP